MSTRFIPTQDSKNQKYLKWLNALTHIHDIYCNCYNPLTHTITLIFEKESDFNFNPSEKQLIQKCLSGEGHTTPAGDPGDVLVEGDLDALFGEPFEDDDKR